MEAEKLVNLKPVDRKQYYALLEQIEQNIEEGNGWGWGHKSGLPKNEFKFCRFNSFLALAYANYVNSGGETYLSLSRFMELRSARKLLDFLNDHHGAGPSKLCDSYFVSTAVDYIIESETDEILGRS